MYVLALMQTVYRLEERAQVSHGVATTSGDAPWPARFASDTWAQYPKYSPGLRRQTVEPQVARESKAMPGAVSCDAVASLVLICAWCQQYISWQRVPTSPPLQISHGICARCYVQVLREIES
jgi:hypothetical protein